MILSKKSLGQNYLIDKNIIKKILNTVKVENNRIIEIGPGKGALTDEILKKNPKSLYLIEKDNFLFNQLKFKYQNYKQVKIYNADILKFDIDKILKKNTIIFGNLPYNISSQILIKFIRLNKSPPLFNDIIFMFQKELGDKIQGKFKSKNYGRISIISNFKLLIKKKFLVSRNCFWPKPKVTSAVLHFKPKNKILFNIKNIYNLEKVTNILFSNKRKMINKNVNKVLSKKQIKQINELDLSLRPSEIKPEIYYKITELFEKNY